MSPGKRRLRALPNNGCKRHLSRHLIYCWVRPLPTNGCFSVPTVLALSKYATICTLWRFVLKYWIYETVLLYIYITVLSCMGLRGFLNLPSPRTAFQVAGLIQSWAHLLPTSWISLIIYLRWWTSNCYQIKFLLFTAKWIGFCFLGQKQKLWSIS
jgi:hypothetical protein